MVVRWTCEVATGKNAGTAPLGSGEEQQLRGGEDAEIAVAVAVTQGSLPCAVFSLIVLAVE